MPQPKQSRASAPNSPSQKTTLLALETSGTVCGIALADIISNPSTPHQCSLVAELSFFEPFQHDRVLAEGVRTLLQLTERTASHVQVVAVSSGPGSFTGLRIGAAFAKAFCFEDSLENSLEHSLEKTPRLLPVPTMNAIAFAARKSAQMLGFQQICVLIPSHKDLVYCQVFSNETFSNDAPSGDSLRLIPTSQIPQSADIFYAGSYFAVEGIFSQNASEAHQSSFPRLEEYCRITPRMIADYAVHILSEQAFVRSSDFVPLYAQEFIPKV
ncbi:MAG: tRNA (adenosine(37)-N6)-threonylcarbamoyltransferase complex dimerization subunit type 1 TsaB [Candidatus Kapaibacterium sp.]|nr:MAG: tRNA (adenosine(37)-N6)-threonylcarbamoyltransferase complex dimerization subunit type 1 TsaB [Candidatus Kapabacteria bacterium]